MPNPDLLPQISARALDLMLHFECGGRAGYVPHPEWPEGDSGITIGIGYDLGYCTCTDLERDWWSLGRETVKALLPVVGMAGSQAANALKTLGLQRLTIPWECAEAVFLTRTLPAEIAKTLTTFPGVLALPADCRGALVSLVYNRGPSLAGPRRTEMAEIARILAPSAGPDAGAAAVVLALAGMCRLWPQEWTGSSLFERRLHEAALFARGLRAAGLIGGAALLLGDAGEPVAALQRRLGGLKVDGQFGPRTLRAVWEWEAARHAGVARGIWWGEVCP